MIYIGRDQSAVDRLSQSIGTFYQLLVFTDISGCYEQKERYDQGENRTKAVIPGFEWRNTALPPVEKDVKQGQEDESDRDPELFFPSLVVEDIDKNATYEDHCYKQDQDAAGARADSPRAKGWHGFYLQRSNPVQPYLHIPEIEGEFKCQCSADGCQKHPQRLYSLEHNGFF